MDEFQPQKGDRFWIDYKKGAAVVEVLGIYGTVRAPHYRVEVVAFAGNPKYIGGSRVISGRQLTSQRLILNPQIR